MAFLSALRLRNFRSYHETRLENLEPGFIVLYGPNGAGKTNILEAVSLLAPGRGLRSARYVEMQNRSGGEPWSISAISREDAGDEINGDENTGDIRLGTGLDPDKPSGRRIRIQGVDVKSQSALADHMACIWLTPQMDGLFIGSPQERRRFLDRLIFTFDPAHSGRISRYENALRQRSKLLQDGSKTGNSDPIWLEGLEAQMAETGIAIAAARIDFVHKLQNAASSFSDTPFPTSSLKVSGTLEELLSGATALDVENMYKYQLSESRNIDMQTGGAATGPHKSDLDVTYKSKQMTAASCSTGEQKALLIGLVLAHARLVAAERGAPPLLLLDEIAAHLDEARRPALYDILKDLNAQVWLTGTDHDLFKDLQGTSDFFRIVNSQIHPEG